MSAQRSASLPGRIFALCAMAASFAGIASQVQAQSAAAATGSQDSAFLACAAFADRGQRIACLEDALDAAVAAQTGQAPSSTAPAAAPALDAPTVPAPQTTQAPQAPAAPTAATATTAPADAVSSNDRSLLDRIRGFGQDKPSVSLSTDDSGQDRLHDSITALEKRNNLWIVTLSSGQVWRQTYPRALQLREGDEIAIYREGIGNSFRLDTPRLSGFIRVERVK